MKSPESNRSRPRALLIGAMVAGLALAAIPLVQRPPQHTPALPEGAAAIVNGVPIDQAEYTRALNALAADAGRPLSQADAQHVLSRLIEQELLVQRALELGLDQRDRTVRNTMVTAMVQMILAEAESETFTDEEVRAFYEEHAEYFTRTGRIHLREIRVPVTDAASEDLALEKAEAAAARLRLGEPFEAVASEIGSPPVAPLPDGLIPPGQLRTYLGPTPARAALALQPGQVSDPVRGGTAWHVLLMVDREAGARPALDEVEPLVRTEMRRRAGDAAIREYLEGLTAQANILR